MKINPLIESKLLSGYSEIQHFVSSKPFFLRSPKYLGDYSDQSQLNLRALGEQFEIAQENIILLDQTHSSSVAVIHDKEIIHQTDAAITKKSGFMLVVLASDCVPILLFDPHKKVIGVIHAGWRGLEGGVIENTLNTMKSEFDCSHKNVICYIGPCISQENYEVGEELIGKFWENYFDNIIPQGNFSEKYYLDIRGIAKKQLIENGVSEANIETISFCTFGDETLFHSYRRATKTGENYIGNNAFGIMLK